MAVTVRDDSISRSIMFLCLGTAAVLLVIQWRAWASGVGVEPPRSAKSVVAKPIVVKPIAARKTVLAQAMVAQTAPQVQSIPTTPPKPSPSTVSAGESADQVGAATAAADSTTLTVDLSDRRVYLYQGKKKLTSYPLAVGKDGWETPTGSFKVIEMQQNPEWLHPITKEVIAAGPDNPLGKRWIGFLIEGQTHIGFHGTNEENLIGQAVSHGCLRMRNKDVIALYEKVKLGTLVTVRP